jgi:hypothetical protein
MTFLLPSNNHCPKKFEEKNIKILEIEGGLLAKKKVNEQKKLGFRGGLLAQ